MYEYNIETNTVRALPPLSAPVAQHVALFRAGKLYIEGGFSSDGVLSVKEYIYDVVTGATVANETPPIRLAATAGVTTAERFMAIGGKTVTQYSASITHLSLTEETDSRYVTSSRMPVSKSGAGAAILNNKVYIAGGLNNTGVLQTFEVMDLGWGEKTPPPERLTGYEAVECNGSI